MVFLIQNTQNRDTEAIQVKLGRVDPRNECALSQRAPPDLKELEEDKLDAFRTKYRSSPCAARENWNAGLEDAERRSRDAMNLAGVQIGQLLIPARRLREGSRSTATCSGYRSFSGAADGVLQLRRDPVAGRSDAGGQRRRSGLGDLLPSRRHPSGAFLSSNRRERRFAPSRTSCTVCRRPSSGSPSSPTPTAISSR